MPKLTCPCGHQINLSPIPNRQGYLMIREPAVDLVVADLSNEPRSTMTARQISDMLSTQQPDHYQVYECPVCGRLAVFDNASDSTPLAWYAREEWRAEE